MAFTVSVALLKGGAGKTTTSIALGEAAAAVAGPVTIVDTDPMGAAVRWSVLAEEAGRPLLSNVVGMPTADLPKRIGTITSAASVVVIDAPPPGALAVAKAAIASADVVVMPCPARIGDLDRVPATIAEAQSAGVRVFGVLNFSSENTTATESAKIALQGWGVELLDTYLLPSVRVSNNYGRRPVGPLARFGRELLDELTEKVAHG